MACMSKGKVCRVGKRFADRLGEGWEVWADDSRKYEAGAVAARRGDLKVVMDIGWYPSLKVSAGNMMVEETIRLPNLESCNLGDLMANIAWAIADIREAGNGKGV